MEKKNKTKGGCGDGHVDFLEQHDSAQVSIIKIITSVSAAKMI